MSGDRLTRTELSWLLTQEAKSAAQKLRVGVGLPVSPPSGPHATPPPAPVILPAPSEDGGVEHVLNRLDETMTLLASLHGQAKHGRRGKIDVAALMWEIAPEARVQIEMGDGLVVFGDESELRRMLLVLIALADPGAKGEVDVSIRREAEVIRIAVELGPDTSQGFETETQWLSRMALRYGGHLAIDGNTQTLSLPASDDTREVETLRKELAAAQAQGEAYARELAAVMARSEPPPSRSTGAPSATGLSSLVGTARALVTDIRGILAAVGRDMAPLRERGRWGEHDAEIAQIAVSVNRHVTAASEVVSDLARLAGCPLFELPSACHVDQILREVVKAETARAARHEVTIEVDAPDDLPDEILPANTVAALFQDLLDSAISVSPNQSTVRVALASGPTGLVVTFDDAGDTLSAKAKSGAGHRDFDALVQERASCVPLIAAFAIAGHLHAPLSLEDAPRGGTRVRVVFPRPSA